MKLFKQNPDEELPIDFCPRCNEKLADKKVTTRKQHDELNHPEIFFKLSDLKKQKKRIIAWACLIAGTIVFLSILEPLIDYTMPERSDKVEWCDQAEIQVTDMLKETDYKITQQIADKLMEVQERCAITISGFNAR